jgi:hypothetical protein
VHRRRHRPRRPGGNRPGGWIPGSGEGDAITRNIPILIVGLAALPLLTGCGKKADNLFGGDNRIGQGRYQGVGHFPASRLWREVVRPSATNDPARALPKDDDEVIVVLDSTTGEVRQCGNFSGRCIGMNPWTAPLAETEKAPASLTKHLDRIEADQDAEREVRTQPATAAAKPQPKSADGSNSLR